ncbi:MAG: lamin tail domain-containing protein [Acidimicrobiia bacterium]|nr:lamin tail domain-containing protein [Acidimicrobiia bacterium]
MKHVRLIVIGLVLLCGTSCAAEPAGTTGPTSLDRSPTTTLLSAPPAGTNPPGVTAELLETIDGDSLSVSIDGTAYEVRLIGINAPERDECHGDASRTQLDALLGASQIVLETTTDDTDQFGRLLRYVWIDGVEVNAQMLAAGGAIALQTGHERQDDYWSLAREATRQRRGMWATDACGPATVQALSIAPIEYNPAGADGENAINEWVEITNLGSEPVDMTGWTLRDESSTHRYVFGSITLDPAATVRVRSGCGEDRGLDLVWCAADAVWNNSGDTAILQDASGNVVTLRTYEDGFPTARFLDE